MFRRIDGADTHHGYVIGLHWDLERREIAVKPAAAGEIGDRDAMQIAALGAVQVVIVGMGVEPEHEEFAAFFLGGLGDAGKGSRRQCMVAAEEDRCASTLLRLIGGFGERLHPACGFRQVFDRLVRMAAFRKRGSGAIPEILDAMAKAFQRPAKPGGTECVRPHQAARLACPDLNGGADKNAGTGIGHSRLLEIVRIICPHRAWFSMWASPWRKTDGNLRNMIHDMIEMVTAI